MRIQDETSIHKKQKHGTKLLLLPEFMLAGVSPSVLDLAYLRPFTAAQILH
jgi:hypothetical protein